MNRATFDSERALNQRAYQSMRDQIKRDHSGQYVALARGQLLAAAPTFAEAQKAVEKLDPVPEYFLIFPAEMEPAFELSYDF